MSRLHIASGPDLEESQSYAELGEPLCVIPESIRSITERSQSESRCIRSEAIVTRDYRLQMEIYEPEYASKKRHLFMFHYPYAYEDWLLTSSQTSRAFGRKEQPAAATKTRRGETVRGLPSTSEIKGEYSTRTPL